MADENKFDIDAAYSALRPHQRALFDLLGITAVGAKKMVDGAVNAFDTTGKIVRGEAVTPDEVKRIEGYGKDAPGSRVPTARKEALRQFDDLTFSRGGLPYVYGYTPPPPGEVY